MKTEEKVKEMSYQGPSWVKSACIYHIFPLGACGAPRRGLADIVTLDGMGKVSEGTAVLEAGDQEGVLRRFDILHEYIPHMKELGCNTLLLGPVWKSESHGYDTTDLLTVDPRLGTNEDLRQFIKACHDKGIRVLLDAVFNHVGRSHWAFRLLQKEGQSSQYKAWFRGLRFESVSPMGDPFVYDTWDGHWNLVALNHDYAPVQIYLLEVVEHWVNDFGIDGLRLDAADVVPVSFWKHLRAWVNNNAPQLWLCGEQVFGDYRSLARQDQLHATTNYEVYKSLWSSYNDKNMHELAYALKRQYQDPGIYKGLGLLNFLDNHDVNRLVSLLRDPRGVFPLYFLLFTLPGLPCVYYGSESAHKGMKGQGGQHDWPLRPHLSAQEALLGGSWPQLAKDISALALFRSQEDDLQGNDYTEIEVGPLHIAFVRGALLVIVNYSETELILKLPQAWTSARLVFGASKTKDEFVTVPAQWGAVFKR